jgi:hypothetical protein
MSMITFYPNRAAKKLPAAQRRTIEKAKDELRTLYQRKPARHRLRPAARRR